MRTRFIFNPVSGLNARRSGLVGRIRRLIAERSLDASLVTTGEPGHATALARRAVEEGCTRVVAVGGDGTMNEVAQALVGTPATLALIPCGSGNGLALHLGLPRGLTTAFDLIAGESGRVVAIDTGAANGRPFFNAMGLGFDAEISRRFNGVGRRGFPAYARLTLAALRDLRAERCVVRATECDVSLDVLLIAVANSNQYGNHALIAPGARVDDGQLDLVAVRPVGLFGAAGLAARLFIGNFDRSRRVLRLQGDRFVIERPAPGIIHTDGEIHATGAVVEVTVRPRSLRLLVPATSRVVAPTARSAPICAINPQTP
jgi:YegS/Rv2252/BmrU family lipid kinase